MAKFSHRVVRKLVESRGLLRHLDDSSRFGLKFRVHRDRFVSRALAYPRKLCTGLNVRDRCSAILAISFPVLLSIMVAIVARAETTWSGNVIVSTDRTTFGSSRTLTIPEGEKGTYYLKLDSEPVDHNGDAFDWSDPDVTREEDSWWVQVKIDGEGRPDADSDTPYRGIYITPSLGREIWGDDSQSQELEQTPVNFDKGSKVP